MPVPRRFDRQPPERDPTRINERIRVPEVRLIDETGQQVGIMKTADALRLPCLGCPSQRGATGSIGRSALTLNAAISHKRRNPSTLCGVDYASLFRAAFLTPRAHTPS